ncbi:heme-degrading domain-containing protein [Paenibacillus lemnae]|uniref:Heme-degrading domain-containing protein n=1 Tax=Paenibacillus lemnae TaxID=1330551 RepID=A0A848MBI0_PAELE|nr:heme-degrading domain-containing protein [Paenibacillus lemnae]NMO98045.1 heme-degrading domain-containing protein [Paenibacillus lemnae]
MEDYSVLLSDLLRQEQELQFTEFNNNTAIKLGQLILSKAFKEGKEITVDIRKNGMTLFHAKMNNNGLGHDRWITRKINTVHHFEHSSYYIHVQMKSWNTTIQDNAFVDSMEYAAEGGCFPIIVKGAGMVGTITVSRLAGHEDHDMVVTSLEQLLLAGGIF